jgi:hypothetical protein
MHRLLATTLLQQDRVDEALAEFVAVLLIDPLDAAAHAGIGRIYVQTGRDRRRPSRRSARATDLAPDDSRDAIRVGQRAGAARPSARKRPSISRAWSRRNARRWPTAAASCPPPR